MVYIPGQTLSLGCHIYNGTYLTLPLTLTITLTLLNLAVTNPNPINPTNPTNPNTRYRCEYGTLYSIFAYSSAFNA